MSEALNVAAWVVVYEVCRFLVARGVIRPTRRDWLRVTDSKKGKQQ